MAVAVAFSMAWRAGGVEGGAGPEAGADQAREAGVALAGLRGGLWRRVTGGGVGRCGLGEGVLGVAGGAADGLALPAWPDGRIRLAADVTAWLRPDAATSPERLFCYVRGRGANAGQVIAGWPYSFVAALGPGASSWVVLLDAVRIGPDD